MSDDRMALMEALQKADDGNFLCSLAETVLQILIEADVEGVIGAGRYERSGDRSTWRNGYMTFPAQHQTKFHSTNPLERLKKEGKRRADVVGIFPNEDSIVRLIGAVLLEVNDEWQLQHRYM